MDNFKLYTLHVGIRITNSLNSLCCIRVNIVFRLCLSKYQIIDKRHPAGPERVCWMTYWVPSQRCQNRMQNCENSLPSKNKFGRHTHSSAARCRLSILRQICMFALSTRFLIMKISPDEKIFRSHRKTKNFAKIQWAAAEIVHKNWFKKAQWHHHHHRLILIRETTLKV